MNEIRKFLVSKYGEFVTDRLLSKDNKLLGENIKEITENK